MGRIRPPARVQLFCGLLSTDEDLLARARQLLKRVFGATQRVSAIMAFEDTDYYAEEMGGPLRRQFVSFETLISPEQIADAKRQTNAIEQEMAKQLPLEEFPRPVNLDPGYLDPGKLVLATTKDRAHRIYLGGGIFAEVTLYFESGAFHPWPWTYPDYQREDYHAFFHEMRADLLAARRAAEREADA